MTEELLKEIEQKGKENILTQMQLIADEHGYKLTKTAEKVAKFMEKRKMTIGICPCHPDTPAPYRGCIGIICEKEIQEKGVCCCNVFTP